MARITALLFSALLALGAYAADSGNGDGYNDEESVSTLIQLFRNGNREKIADIVRYPLARKSPLPAIKDRGEMLQRFDEVFDSRLSRMIAESSPDDWQRVGWRGIMYGNGLLWLDTDGSIRAVNYQSGKAQQLSEQLLAADRTRLHESLRQFSERVLEWRTRRFHIRIDDLGDQNYRYAAWGSSADTANKPDLVLRGGALTWDGSGGNHYYTFSNGRYRYICRVNRIGSDTAPPGVLEVRRDGKLLLHDTVIEVLGE